MLYRLGLTFLQKPCVFLNLSPKTSEFYAFMPWDLKREGVDEAGAGGIVDVESNVAT